MAKMEEYNLLDKIKDFYKKGKINECESLKHEFKRLHHPEIYKYAKSKFDVRERAEAIESFAFEQFFLAITKLDYTTENFQETIKNLVAMRYYSEQLRFERIKNFNSYIQIQKELKKVLLPFLHHIYLPYFEENDCSCLLIKELDISKETISRGAFEIFVTRIHSEKKDFPTVSDINLFVIDGYYFFVLKFVLNKIWVRRIENEVDKIHKNAFASANREVRLKSEFRDISLEANLKFYEKIKSDDFTLNTSFKRYWIGIFENIQKEYLRKLNPDMKMDVDKKEEKYENQVVDKYIIFEFLQDGLEAIKDFKGGKARELLVVGGRSNLKFNQILQEALLNNMPKDFGKPFHYKNKSVENEQRKDCKKELIKWMKAIVKNDDPENKWYGKNGTQIIEFLMEKNINDL